MPNIYYRYFNLSQFNLHFRWINQLLAYIRCIVDTHTFLGWQFSLLQQLHYYETVFLFKIAIQNGNFRINGNQLRCHIIVNKNVLVANVTFAKRKIIPLFGTANVLAFSNNTGYSNKCENIIHFIIYRLYVQLINIVSWKRNIFMRTRLLNLIC